MVHINVLDLDIRQDYQLENGRLKAKPGENINGWPEYDPDPRNCVGYGHFKCLKDGRHSFFNHSQDSYRAYPYVSNVPAGYGL